MASVSRHINTEQANAGAGAPPFFNFYGGGSRHLKRNRAARAQSAGCQEVFSGRELLGAGAALGGSSVVYAEPVEVSVAGDRGILKIGSRKGKYFSAAKL